MIGSGFSFGLGTTLGRVAARGVSALSYLKDNLKIYFDFDSTRAKTLEFVGTGSTQFEGADDEIVVTDHNDLDGMDQLTLMCWMKYDSTCDNGGSLISKDHTIYEVQVDTANDRITFWLDGTSMSGTSSSISINKWYHVACTYTSYDTGEGKIYINGVLDKHDATFDATTIDTNSTNLSIGGVLDQSTNFGGLIKNVGIWNRKLKDSEIQNIMYKTYSDLKGTETTGLLAWYPLESNGNDSTGNHNGTEQGDVTFHNTNYNGKGVIKPRGFDNAPTAQADLIGNGSALFDGISDKINCGEIATLNSATDLTVTAWVKCANTGGGQPIVSCVKDSNEGWMLKITGNTLQVIMDSGSDSHGQTASNTFKNDTTGAGTGDGWHHLAMVFDGGGADNAAKLKCYKNGTLMTLTYTGTIPTAVDDLAGYNVYIGHYDTQGGTDQFFLGYIAQVGIWEAALTQEQIQSVKEKSYSELTISEKEYLVSWWGLDSVLTATMTAIPGGDAQDMVVADLHNGETLGSEQFIGALAYTDNDLYFKPYDNNKMSYTSNSVTITHEDNTAGALWFFNSTTNPAAGHLGLITGSIDSGAVYKITIDLTTDDSNLVLLSQNSATGNIYSTPGSGTKTFYILGKNTGSTYMRVSNLSAEKSVTLSNFSIKKVTQNHGFLL